MLQIISNATNAIDLVEFGWLPSFDSNQVKDRNENYDVNVSQMPAIDRNFTGRKYRSVEIAETVFIHQQSVLAISRTVVAQRPQSRLRERAESQFYGSDQNSDKKLGQKICFLPGTDLAKFFSTLTNKLNHFGTGLQSIWVPE